MTFDLLDANVWLALFAANHAHHLAARAWNEQRDASVAAAFCRVTQMAFLRHLTHRAIMQADALDAEGAWHEYDNLRRKADIIWLAEPDDMDRKWCELGTKGGVSGNWWTNAYLAAFAIGHDIRLVTFDTDFRRFEPDGLKLLLLAAQPLPTP